MLWANLVPSRPSQAQKHPAQKKFKTQDYTYTTWYQTRTQSKTQGTQQQLRHYAEKTIYAKQYLALASSWLGAARRSPAYAKAPRGNCAASVLDIDRLSDYVRYSEYKRQWNKSPRHASHLSRGRRGHRGSHTREKE